MYLQSMNTKQKIIESENTLKHFGLIEMIYFSIWFGILSVLIEITFLETKELMGGATFFLRYQKMWMAPTVNVIILLILGLFAMPVTLRLSRPIAIRVICVLFGSVSFLSILCLESRTTFSRIHFVPKVILAIGLAITLQRLISHYALVFDRFVRRTTVSLVLLVLVLTAVLGVKQYYHESKTIAVLPPPPKSVPNVLLVVLDTVRAESMSLFGYERMTTPFLKNFAKEGVVFEWAIAPSSHTRPTHATLFTGRFPNETGVNWGIPLDLRFPTLAEFLSRHGYATAGFVANTVVLSASRSGLARGFSHYEDQITLIGRFGYSSPLIRFALQQNWVRQLIGFHDLLGRKRANRITNDFMRWFDSIQNGRPFFAFLNYYDAHQPYMPPTEFRNRFGTTDQLKTYLARYMHDLPCSPDNTPPSEIKAMRNAYDAAIAYLDTELKRLFAELKRRNVLDQTFVIVVSDHGEEFGGHSTLGHGYDLHIQLIHVPLLLRFPASVPAGVSIKRPVSLRDIPATIMEILHFSDVATFPGHSISRHWSDSDSGNLEPNDPMLSELFQKPPWDPEWSPVYKGDMKSLVIGDIHYIRNGDGTEEVYDLREDPVELNNLIDKPQGVEIASQAKHIIEQIIP